MILYIAFTDICIVLCESIELFLLISIGNNMISSVNLVLISTSKFFKDRKIAEPVGRVQFVVFEKFTSAYIYQIA